MSSGTGSADQLASTTAIAPSRHTCRSHCQRPRNVQTTARTTPTRTSPVARRAAGLMTGARTRDPPRAPRSAGTRARRGTGSGAPGARRTPATPCAGPGCAASGCSRADPRSPPRGSRGCCRRARRRRQGRGANRLTGDRPARRTGPSPRGAAAAGTDLARRHERPVRVAALTAGVGEQHRGVRQHDGRDDEHQRRPHRDPSPGQHGTREADDADAHLHQVALLPAGHVVRERLGCAGDAVDLLRGEVRAPTDAAHHVILVRRCCGRAEGGCCPGPTTRREEPGRGPCRDARETSASVVSRA